jgi:hypothetical protein
VEFKPDEQFKKGKEAWEKFNMARQNGPNGGRNVEAANAATTLTLMRLPVFDYRSQAQLQVFYLQLSYR